MQFDYNVLFQEGLLAESPSYICQPLNGTHLTQICYLHSQIIKEFDGTSFVMQKTPEQFRAYLGPLGQTLGIFLGSEMLVGMGSVALPQSNNPKNDITDQKVFEMLGVNPWQAAIFQSDHVYKPHRKHGIHQKLIQERENLAQQLGRCWAIAEIATANGASSRNYIRQGFQEVLRSKDPVDNCPLIYVAKKLDF